LGSSRLIATAPGNDGMVFLTMYMARAGFMGVGVRGLVLNLRTSRRVHRANQ
jgi:hypothetical protein